MQSELDCSISRFSVMYSVPLTSRTNRLLISFDGELCNNRKWSELQSISVSIDETLGGQVWLMDINVEAPIRPIFAPSQKISEDEIRSTLFDALHQLRFNATRMQDAELRYVSALLERAIHISTETFIT